MYLWSPFGSLSSTPVSVHSLLFIPRNTNTQKHLEEKPEQYSLLQKQRGKDELYFVFPSGRFGRLSVPIPEVREERGNTSSTSRNKLFAHAWVRSNSLDRHKRFLCLSLAEWRMNYLERHQQC